MRLLLLLQRPISREPCFPSSRPDRDEIFDILSNSRRRTALRYLRDHRNAGPVDVTDLVDAVTQREVTLRNGENDKDLQKLRASVYSAMVQSHLPRMDDYGIVEYDSSTQTVRLTPEATHITPYLDQPGRSAVRWNVLYLLLAVAMGVVAFAGLSGVRTLERWSPYLLFALFAIGVGLLAVVRLFSKLGLRL